MAPGGRASALSLPQILNECQKSTSTDFQRKCARMLADRRREEPVELVEELLGATRHAFVVGKREPAVERLIKFVCALATEREPGVDGAEDDVFLEELLSALLPLAGAADKAVRFRVCQLVASLLDGLSADTELTDQLYEQLGATMTEHLRDRAPSVRMQAARALARLQDPGEAGDFSEDATTAALLSVLECDKNQDVRRAVVASVGVSCATVPALVQRTRDNSDEVRRTAFLTLAAKVPLGSLSIASRATLLRRGLADRSLRVRDSAVVLLGKWLQACGGDVVRLLGALDVETHEAVAETLLTNLIECGAIKPSEIAVRDAATGLRRSEADGLLSAELALYWRIICEALTDDATALGTGAALGGGQAAAVAAASAGEKLEALEAALPPTMVEYCELVRRHTAGGATSRFASRQLLRLACKLDLSDAAASRAASSLAEELLQQGPAAGMFGAGGRGDWERTLVSFAVTAVGAAAADTVYAAAASICDGTSGADAAWVQALGIVVPLLESAASLSAAGGSSALRTLREDLVLPAVQHASAAVRREGVRALGLLCMLEPPSASAIALLRGAAACDARPVRTHATRALCDLALLHGPEKLDEALPPAAAGAVDEAQVVSSAPLIPALLLGLQEPAEGLAAPLAGAAEDEEELRTVAAEGIAKLLLLDAVGAAGADDTLTAKALAHLLVLHLDADEHAHPRLAQCLTVFLPTYAAASVAHKQLLARAAPLALRMAASRKWLPRLGACIATLMNAETRGADAPADMGAEQLAQDLLREALYVHHTYGRVAATKAYLATLTRTAAALTVRAPETLALDGMGAVAKQAAAVHNVLALAQLAHGRLSLEKTLMKELDSCIGRLAALPGVPQAPPLSEERQVELLAVVLQASEQLGGALPFAPPVATAYTPAGRRPARASKTTAQAKLRAAAAADDCAGGTLRVRRATAAAAPAADSDSDSDASDEEDDDSDEEETSDVDAPPPRAPLQKQSGRAAVARAVLADNVVR